MYYTEKLVVIDVNEDARISSEETIKQDVLEVKAQEGGEIIIDAEVEQMLNKICYRSGNLPQQDLHRIRM